MVELANEMSFEELLEEAQQWDAIGAEVMVRTFRKVLAIEKMLEQLLEREQAGKAPTWTHGGSKGAG